MKDLDDDTGTVEHLNAGRALEVARLARRNVVVDRDEIDLRFSFLPVVERIRVVDLIEDVLIVAAFFFAT